MVFFYTCSDPRYIVFAGKNKFENEELLKYSFPEDIWFHVDKLSSAHIYLRLPPGTVDIMHIRDKNQAKRILRDALESVPEEVVQEMAQLTKANSIDGCKAAEVDIVYTPFLNLRKEERMDTGQVGFKDEEFRIMVHHVERDRDVVKRLEKSKREELVDFPVEKEERDRGERERRRRIVDAQKQREKQEEKDHAIQKELRSYSALASLDKTSNVGISQTGTVEECRSLEDDFM
eukprot:NODE_16617_length_985_cov_5.361305.p2 GENE.NODE_16617_length_985_cov_5.361305~~NODE_16617_length_985_cov_5.361305.p2  ORF type:complete len:246 (-),score=81.34 NODE_16617_length_985_cov_5.361305:248-946(-)